MAKKIILTKMNLGGGVFSKNGGLRWTAQINGKFIKWKKMIDTDEILALREAILDLHSKFGNLSEIDVRDFVDHKTGYSDIPVHLYIESYGNVKHLRQDIIEYREKQADEAIQKVIKGKDEFPFLMFDKD
jgi:hypothetical protein